MVSDSEDLDLRVDAAEEEFGLYHKGQLLTTVAGGPVVSSSRELLEEMRQQLEALPSLGIVGSRPDVASIQEMSPLDTYLLFSTQKDLVEPSNVAAPDFHEVLAEDPLLRSEDEPEWAGQLDTWAPSRALAIELGLPLTRPADLGPEERQAFAEALQTEWQGLPASGQVVFLSLRALHGGHVLSPMALVADRCTAVEYANAVMPNLDQFCACRDHALSCQTYLSHFRVTSAEDLEALHRLIAAGESDRVEFKETLRKNVHTKQHDKNLVHSCLKTIAAFLNTSGGDLLIGVVDDGTIGGIKKDGFANDDGFLLHLFGRINERLGPSCASDVKAVIYEVEGKKVCWVSCRKSSRPVFLKGNPKPRVLEDEFYIRSGPSTECLPASQIIVYVDERFGIRKST